MLLIFGVTFINLGDKLLTLHYPRFYVITSTFVFITQGIDLSDKL